jgi:hypothetical protein
MRRAVPGLPALGANPTLTARRHRVVGATYRPASPLVALNRLGQSQRRTSTVRPMVRTPLMSRSRN